MKIPLAVCILMRRIHPIDGNYKKIVEMANVRAGTERIATLAHKIAGIVLLIQSAAMAPVRAERTRVIAVVIVEGV